MPKQTDNVERLSPGRMMIARTALIVFGVICLAIGGSTLYLIKGVSLGLSVAFVAGGFAHVLAGCFARGSVVSALTFLWW
jgi:hypothetical protein